MVAVDIDAHRETAIRIDDELRGRLPSPATPVPGLDDQLIVQQALRDVRDGGRRQSRDVREIRARERPVHPDGVQRHPLIVITGTFEIRAR